MILFRFNLGLTIVLGSFVCDVLSVGEAVEVEISRIPNADAIADGQGTTAAATTEVSGIVTPIHYII